MTIKGAIFDCDGTLVDSMGMWGDVWDWLADAHGIERVPLERIESLSQWDTCAFYRDELGVDAPVQQLYDEVCERIAWCYANEVKKFPEVERFLGELAAAGIPMIVASSTPAREVRGCLAAHGLDKYFVDVVSTEDVGGRDKEFPDVYFEAARRLGTSPADTWVFEDAPFGVQTSRKAGFFVVGLMNDHDGRREEDVRPWSDVYAHGYPELSLALLEDYARPADAQGACAAGEKRSAAALRALIVAGSPEPSAPALVAELAAVADYVIAADRGAEALLAAGAAPDVFVGDSDSVSAEAAAWARAHAATDIDFPAEKYATDLALAIDCASHEAARREAPLALTVTCASGGRPDHFLAVVGLLAQAPAASARLVEDAFELRILKPEGEARWELGEEALGRTFSAIAVAPGTRVDEDGMQWNLDDYAMPLLGDLGVSNKVAAADAAVTCRQGALAAVLLR